jgi:hypothetical protein
MTVSPGESFIDKLFASDRVILPTARCSFIAPREPWRQCKISGSFNNFFLSLELKYFFFNPRLNHRCHYNIWRGDNLANMISFHCLSSFSHSTDVPSFLYLLFLSRSFSCNSFSPIYDTWLLSAEHV